MNRKEMIKNAVSIIDNIYSFDYDIELFIQDNNMYFSDMPLRSLLAFSYIKTDITDESTYIFLIGSYLFFQFTGCPLTWLSRRRFSEFSFDDDWNLFFSKTVTYNNDKYSSINDVRNFLLLQLMK